MTTIKPQSGKRPEGKKREKMRTNTVGQTRADDAICNEHISLELEALAQLVHPWSNPLVVKKRRRQFEDKVLDDFRSAVLTGLRPRGERGSISEKIPHELLQDEVSIVQQSLSWYRQHVDKNKKTNEIIAWVRKTKVPYEVKAGGEIVTIERPFVGSENMLLRFASNMSRAKRTSSPSDILNMITASRLAIGEESVRRNKRKKRTFGDPIQSRSEAQKLLASIFVDLVSHQRNISLQALILDVLLGSGYHVMCLYYLTQQSHMTPSTISLGLPSENQIHYLCKKMLATAGADFTRPFSKLFVTNSVPEVKSANAK